MMVGIGLPVITKIQKKESTVFELINVSVNRAVIDRSSDLGNLMELIMVFREVSPGMEYNIIRVG